MVTKQNQSRSYFNHLVLAFRFLSLKKTLTGILDNGETVMICGLQPVLD